MAFGFEGYSMIPAMGFGILTLVFLWELIWKGIGLWHSAQGKQKIWFIAILILNTAGILPIIYLLFFKKGKTGYEALKPLKTRSFRGHKK